MSSKTWVTCPVIMQLSFGPQPKTRSKRDRREWRIALTQSGRDGLQISREVFANINATLDETFTPPAQNDLAVSLLRLRARFER